MSQKKAGYKLSCPVPLYCNAWENIFIWVGAHEIRAELLVYPGNEGKHSTEGKFNDAKACWKVIADEKKFPQQYERFSFPVHIPQDSEAVLSSLLLMAAVVANLNQPDKTQLAGSLMSTNLANNNIMAAALKGGLVMQSSHSKLPLSLYCPAGLSHAIIHAPVLTNFLNIQSHEGSLSLWLFGLMYSNFEVLRESFNVYHNQKPLITELECLWILPLFDGQFWWIAAQNNQHLESTLDKITHWPQQSGFPNIEPENVYRTDIDRQGAIKH